MRAWHQSATDLRCPRNGRVAAAVPPPERVSANRRSRGAPMTLPESLSGKTVAVLGGTGPQGRGLARRFADAGLPVVIGSRSAERAADAAKELAAATGGDVTGADNAGAAAAGDIVVVAVPWDGHGELLAEPDRGAGRQGRRRLREPARLRQAGRLRAAGRGGLRGPAGAGAAPGQHGRRRVPQRQRGPARGPRGRPPSTPTSSCSATCARRPTWSRTCARTIPGVRGIFGGRLRNAHQVEALTANLISVNRRYKAHAGVRVTDV